LLFSMCKSLNVAVNKCINLYVFYIYVILSNLQRVFTRGWRDFRSLLLTRAQSARAFTRIFWVPVWS